MATNLDRFVRSIVRRSAATISQRGFGTAMLVAYNDAWLQRSRLFTSPDDVLSALVEGFEDSGLTHAQATAKALQHPHYLAAVALCANTIRPPTFKLGRRAGKPTQRMRFTPATPQEGEEYSITIRGVTFAVVAGATPTVSSVIDLFVALMTADVDAIIASGVSTAATAQELDASDLNGVVGAELFDVPRNITLALNNHADWDLSTIVVTGLDARGLVQTESFAVPNGGNTTLVGTKLWTQITGIAIPPQSGTNGQLTAGVGTRFDLHGQLAFTATDGSTYLDLVNGAAGDWHSYEWTENLALEDRSIDDGTTSLTEDLAAIKASDADFYALTVEDAGSAALIELASAWAETQVIQFWGQSSDAINETSDEAGIVTSIRELGRVRTNMVQTRTGHLRRLAAAILGRVLPNPVGSAPYTYKTIPGQLADSYDEEIITRLCGTRERPQNGKCATIYIEGRPTGTNLGTAFTYGGLCSAGEWIHKIAGIDAMNADVQADGVARRIANEETVPFTERGAAADEGGLYNVLLKYARAPFNLLVEESISTTHTPVASVSDLDKQAGFYDGVQGTARTQGTINALTVRVSVQP